VKHFVAVLLVAGCAQSGEPVDSHELAVDAYCDVEVRGVGTVDAETDYLPHVVQCENGGADLEALKAQAVAARSYMYYKMETSGSLADGTSDQVYSCGADPLPIHRQAVDETAGEVLRYGGVTVCAFFVAGANPGDRATCIATGADPDPTDTEQWVTYNEGRSGDGIEQTPLGWVDPGNLRNRGCQSQWGARCLDERGAPYDDILRFYYGDDIGLERATGPCVGADPCVPLPEECNCVDDDCNGLVDDGAGACPDVARLVDGSFPARVAPGDRVWAFGVWRNEGAGTWTPADVVPIVENDTDLALDVAGLPHDVPAGETVRVDVAIEVPGEAALGPRDAIVRLRRGEVGLGDPCDGAGALSIALEVVPSGEGDGDADGGVETGDFHAEAGCSCRVPASSGGDGALALWALATAPVRRRRR